MKKFLKSLNSMVSIIASGLLVIHSNGVFCNATENPTNAFEDFSQFRYVGYDNTSTEDSSEFSYSLVTSPEDSGSNTNNIPSKYDMRELGLVTGTEYQGQYGTCWAFGATESAVSRILDKNPFADFSEWHLAYFTYFGDGAFSRYDKLIQDENGNTITIKETPFEKGGNSAFATATLSKWIGLVSEDVAPYNSSNTLDESLRFQSDYHLTDAYCFNGAFSTSNFSAYFETDIKNIILNGNSVTLNFHFDTSSDYYSDTENSYYFSDTTKEVNHGVTIVGWDDDFNSFDTLSRKPKSKGAWLVKNSWDYKFGDYGYFWISYETLPMIDATAYIVSSNENYSSNYYLDEYGWTTSINSLNESIFPFAKSKYYDYASNVFTSNEDTDVCAVSFYTTDYNTDYEVYVYTNLTDENNPTSGELVSQVSGIEEYIGYHTVPLETPASVSEGEKYSIVVRFKNNSYKNTIAVESSIRIIDIQNGVEMVNSYNVTTSDILEHSNNGESFISNDGINWIDTRGVTGIMSSTSFDFSYNYSYDVDTSNLKNGTYAISTLGNVCIKAFTNPKGKVYFSQYGGNLYKDETIELSSHYDDATIYYTLDGSTPTTDSLKYTEPITFTGENLTISASVFLDGTLYEPYIENFTQSKAVVSTLCAKQSNGINSSYTEIDVSQNGNPKTELYLNCPKDTKTINLYPISTGEITIANDSVISGHESNAIEVYNGMIIPITVTKDGSITTEYTLTINIDGNDNPKLLGDINQDNSITFTDLLLMKKHTLKLKNLNDNQISMGDFNNDNIINIIDILYLKRILLTND